MPPIAPAGAAARRLRLWPPAVRLLFRASPVLAGALAATIAGGAAASAFLIVFTGRLVGSIPEAIGAGLESDAGRRMLLALAAFGAVAVVGVLLASWESALTAVLRLRVTQAVEDRVLAASLRRSGIAHLEDPDHADRVRLATAPETRPELLVQCLPAVVRPRLLALGLVLILVPFTWWAPAVLCLAAVLTYRQYLTISDNVYGSLEASTGVIRRAGYFRSLAVDPEPAAEVRLFGLGGWLVERMTDTWRTGMAAVWSSRRAAEGRGYLTVLFLVAAEGLVLGVLAVRAARGEVGLGELVTYAQAAIALPLAGWVGDPDYLIRKAFLGVRALRHIESDGEAWLPDPAGSRVPDPGQPHHEIVVESVSFAYPGGGRNVLDGLGLRIPAGRSVAIVGANGAGKTTLIKLLTRLYDPDRGRIRVDGVDLRELDPAAWRARTAVVFQDFQRYPLSLRDNVGLGDPEAARDDAALLRALAAVGGSTLPGDLPAGWDTVLSRQRDGGTDLSGGQWQKVALARALLAARQGGLLILDEPTANLDARAEFELFERLLDLTHGATTVLISHRFSSIRRADLIYVLDRGRVVEAGSHAELMATGGRYAEMFRLQAASFLDSGSHQTGQPRPVAPGPGSRRAAPASAEPRPAPPRPAAEPAAPPPDASGEPGPERRSVRSLLAALGMLLAGAFRESGRLTVLGLVLVPAAAALSAVQALWMRDLVDAAAVHLLGPTLLAALLLTGTLGAGRGIELAGVTARITLSERVGFAFDRSLATLTASIPSLRHHESPAFLDRLHLLRSRTLGLGGLLNWILNLVTDLGGFIVTAVLLATVHPLLLLLPLVGLGTLRLQIVVQLMANRSHEAAAGDHRLAGQLMRLATSPAGGSELRIYNAGAQTLRQQQDARRRADALIARTQWRVAVIGATGGLLNTCAMLAAVGFITSLAAGNAVSLGAVLLGVILAGRFIEHISGLIRTTGVVVDLLGSAERLRWLHAYARQVRPATPSAPVPAGLRDGIAFERVSFRYPGTATAVLREIDLRLPAGSVVALVGENGAGKTTLVKLLCRFYEPTAGRIRVDGARLDGMCPDQWRVAASAAFQDFVRFELQAREAVGVGDLPRITAPAAVAGALHRAGAQSLPGELPDGLDTQLGKRWPGGVDLSGGQWQKIALARAAMRARPLLLILDEPTAALDAETEHSLFERFSAAARRSRITGAITVLVSHRFSTVRMADLIVVLHRGRVVEIGDHEQLLAQDGLYADLYGLQANAYTQSPGRQGG